MTNRVVVEARQELIRLIIIPIDKYRDIDKSQMLVVNIKQLEDNVSNDIVSYLFLNNIRNI